MSDTLPPLPNPFVSFSPVSAMVYLGPGDYYTADQMRSYALAAVTEKDAEMERLRKALGVAVRQNEHDMVMTGEEIRECRAAIDAAKVK